MKNLANAPPCLQRMLLELQRYDVTIKYRPGNQMQLADALSCCLARASQEIKLDIRVDYIAFTKPWIEKLKDNTQRDPILVTVYQLTQLSRRDSLRQWTTIPEQGVCQVSLWLRHQTHHLITRVSPL